MRINKEQHSFNVMERLCLSMQIVLKPLKI